MARISQKPVRVFYAYAPEDEELRQKLENHLSLLRRQEVITDWHDRQIVPGTEWAEAMNQQLNNAALILLMISADFLASDYCYGKEMLRALERHENKEARVVPILLRSVDWQQAPFARLQCLPRNGKPVTLWDDQDAAFLDITKGIQQTISDLYGSVLPVPRLLPMDRNNRKSMLRRVRAFWIRGVLDTSLRGVPLLSLAFQEEPGAVANPWRQVIQEIDLPPSPLPAGTNILQLYDDVDGGLLLLGEPGAGKTIQLLVLARQLLDRAEQDTAHPIPVVFTLSSWATRQQPLTIWFVEELRAKYQVPQEVGQSWVTTGRILPLLDGLDEVVATQRTACVKAINHYRQNYPLASLVVCSRRAEYLALEGVQLEVQRAIVVQPLTTSQIDAYLLHAGEQGEAVHAAVSGDPLLRELATTPLVLNVLLLTTQGVSPEEQTMGTSADVRGRIFGNYVQRMLERRGKERRYTQEQTLHWLSWLAGQMVRHNQTAFSIEQLQPDWLAHEQARAAYQTIMTWVWSLMGGLVGLLGGVALGQIFGATGGVIGGLVLGLVCLQTSSLQTGEIEPTPILGWSLRNVWTNLRAFLIMLLRVVVVIILLPLLPILFVLRKAHVDYGEALSRVFDEQTMKIVDRDTIGAMRHALTDLLLGVAKFVDSVYHGVKYLDSENAGKLFAALLIFMVTQVSLLTWLFLIISFGGIVGGFSSKTLPKRETLHPNEGIRRSARQASRVGLIVGLTFALVGGPAFSALLSALSRQPSMPTKTVPFILLIALAGFLLGSLRGGGAQCIKHVVLRGMLQWEGALPRNYFHFLDYAAERILLRRVGGSYIFAHRLLLDYFVELDGAHVASTEGEAQHLHPKSLPSGPLRPQFDDASAAVQSNTHTTMLKGPKKLLASFSSFAQSFLHPVPGAQVLSPHQKSSYEEPANTPPVHQKAVQEASHEKERSSLQAPYKAASAAPSSATPPPVKAQEETQDASEQVPLSSSPTALRHQRTAKETVLMVWLIIAVIVVIAESVVIYNNVYRPYQLRELATAQTSFTATATADVLRQLGTYVAGNDTAQVQVTATFSLFEQHFKQLTRGTPRFDDPMTDSNDDNWDSFSNLTGGCSFANSAYHVTVRAQKVLSSSSCFERGIHFTNFVLQVQMQMEQDAVGGVYFRFDPIKGNGYSFLLGSDGSYGLYVYRNGVPSSLVTGAAAPLAKGGRNQLAVLAQGKDVDLYVNGVYVGSARDKNATSTSGTIGLFAGNVGLHMFADIAYTNVRVWA